MHLKIGKLLKYDLRSKTGRKWADGQNIYLSEKNLSQGGCLPQPRGYIHVYDHNIQISSSLKPLGQSKPNFIWSIVRKGQWKFLCINGQSHMTKMTAMALNSKIMTLG